MVKLIPMEEKDFQPYLEISVKEYAEDHVAAGNWQPSEALAKSAEQFHQLLPNGVATENNYLCTILDERSGEPVGMIWFTVYPNQTAPKAFIYDFRIDEQHRRKGYGTQALAALEEKAAALGVKSIGLHVFSHNPAARGLYEKVGFQVTSLNMVKNL